MKPHTIEDVDVDSTISKYAKFVNVNIETEPTKT
jgi:hypothetical protein